MDVHLGGADGPVSRDLVLYADDELLHGPGQACAPSNREAAPVPAFASHLGAVLRQHICERNRSAGTASLSPLHRRFEVMACTNPGASAVEFNRAHLTYGELDAQANGLALHLLRNGVQPGDFCLVRLEPSFALVRAILAVLKAGAACLQLDPALNQERTTAVLGVLEPTVRITRGLNPDDADDDGIRTIRCDDDTPDWPYGWPDDFPVRPGTPAHAFATLSDAGILGIYVRTHLALRSCAEATRQLRALAAPVFDLAGFWGPLSQGTPLNLPSRGCLR